MWYTGPLGKAAGAEYGADLGFEVGIIKQCLYNNALMLHFQLAFGFSGIVYPPLRWLEIRYTGR